MTIKELLTKLFSKIPKETKPIESKRDTRHDPVEFYCTQCGRRESYLLREVDEMYYLDDLDPFAPPRFDCPSCQIHTMEPIFYQTPSGGTIVSGKFSKERSINKL